MKLRKLGATVAITVGAVSLGAATPAVAAESAATTTAFAADHWQIIDIYDDFYRCWHIGTAGKNGGQWKEFNCLPRPYHQGDYSLQVLYRN